jgi:non-specific serine/threonine protein kinase
VGRRSEIVELTALLDRTRLLTLTGPGGCGKTRLAIEIAAGGGDRFPAGVAFADLSPVRDPAMVSETVAAALGLPGMAGVELVELLAGARLLLVVDNAEHLVEAVPPLVAELLRGCQGLRVLVTSRELLNVAGEVTYRVPPLELPPADVALDPDQLARYDAVKLFAERATEHRTDFVLSAANAASVVAVCRRLDGIPLALELAAARIRSLALPEIAGRLDDAFRLLTNGPRSAASRHQTLRAAVDWSYDLLDGAERCLLQRVAAFVGSFDLDAVEAVCSGPDLPVADVADVLHRLVEKSLMVPDARPDGSLRYRLIETIRQYGQERLAAAGDAELRERHARYFARVVSELDEGDEDFRARDQRMTDDYGNVQLALDWAAGADTALEAAMVRQVRWYWLLRGSVREARQRTLASLGKSHPSPTVRAGLLANAADWSRQAGDLEAAADQIAKAVPLLDQVDDPKVAYQILAYQGVLRTLSGDLAGAERYLTTAVETVDRMPPSRLQTSARNNLAMVLLAAGRPAEALAAIEGAVEGRPWLWSRPDWLAKVRHTQGAILLALDRVAEARDRFLEGLETAAELDNHEAAIALLQGLACVAAKNGDPTSCLVFLGAVQSCGSVAGVDGDKRQEVQAAAAGEASRGLLGARAAEEAWTAGVRMDLRAVLAHARARPGDAVLTPRKMEIVRHVAEGQSNKEIARSLSISERTVEAHLEQLRNQLGFHNRAQVVAWAVSRGLVGQT